MSNAKSSKSNYDDKQGITGNDNISSNHNNRGGNSISSSSSNSSNNNHGNNSNSTLSSSYLQNPAVVLSHPK